MSTPTPAGAISDEERHTVARLRRRSTLRDGERAWLRRLRTRVMTGSRDHRAIETALRIPGPDDDGQQRRGDRGRTEAARRYAAPIHDPAGQFWDAFDTRNR